MQVIVAPELFADDQAGYPVLDAEDILIGLDDPLEDAVGNCRSD